MVLAINAKSLRVGYVSEDCITWAIRGIDLEVSEGEALCLVGESGCGKSTIANAIAGVLPPHSVTEGKLWIFEYLVIDGPRRNYNGIRGKVVNLIPQNPGTSLNPYMTIEEHFHHVLKDLLRLSKKEAKKVALKSLRKVGLDSDVLSMYPHELSGGMQQRVTIAIALVSGAKVLVADEPTSSIDAGLRAQILSLINKLREEYRLTLVLVTHDVLSTVSTCSKVAVMYAGKIVEMGPTEVVLRKPRHPYTRMLLESVPILGSRKPLRPLPGEPPDLSKNFSWCPFRDRCPFKIGVCENEPSLILVDPEKPHYVRCWRSAEVQYEQ